LQKSRERDFCKSADMERPESAPPLAKARVIGR
jgi:hypothetical protein